MVLACVAAVLVDFSDGDLDRRVVFGFDDAVGCGAFAGNVALRVLAGAGLGVFLDGGGREWGREGRLYMGLTDQRALPCRSPCLRLCDEAVKVVGRRL